ncbi:MAG: ATPase, T2SS/T4P/T4SS family [bacterium]
MAGKGGSNNTISDILLRRGVIKPDEMQKAVDSAKEAGGRIERYLVEKKLVSPTDMTLAISEYLRMPPISLAHFTPNPQLIEKIGRNVLARHLALPLAQTGRNLTLALGDPFNITAVDEIQLLTGYDITPIVAAEKEIADVFERFFPESGDGVKMEDLLKEADADLEVGQEKIEDEDKSSIDMESMDTAPVVRMVNAILLESLRTGASDIHLEPQEKALRLRYRIDGSLMERPNPPKSLQGAVLSRMKIMSGMDIAERRIPQDGRIKIRALGKEVDLRVSTLPTIFGEKVCMRILDKTALFPNLGALGLDEQAYRTMKYGISQPYGIIYVTGPTGSGKTTTLYSCLMEMNQPDVNILTCEDPVEYQLPGINQVQINSFVGLTFAAALRSVLRQSPDVILVGETRDSETADIAIKAALTGHLVLSTLHTNDAPGAITRLVDMGVEPSLLASSLILAQAQRLVRKLCQACKKERKDLPIDTLRSYSIDPAIFDGATLFQAGGCSRCHNTGYKGRLAIMEVMAINRELRRDILRGVSSKEIAIKAKSQGMMTLKEIGLDKARIGITSLEGALEVTGGE